MIKTDTHRYLGAQSYSITAAHYASDNQVGAGKLGKVHGIILLMFRKELPYHIHDGAPG